MQQANTVHTTWWTVTFIAMLFLLVGCRPTPLEDARSQVPIGTPRDDAIAILSRTAWYHQPCPNRVTIDDLFFYGSHEYDKAEVVIVGSEPKEGVYVVYQIGSFESYAWQAAYQDCIQREKFEE